VFSNPRDSPGEQARQIDHVRPKLVFIEARLVAQYRGMLMDTRALQQKRSIGKS
jgi:hypothetical protein